MRTGTLSLMLMLGLTLVACGDDDGAAGTSGTGSSGSGGGGSGGAGTGGTDADASTETDAGAMECDEIETVPETVDSDLTIGPGCVRINRTNVRDDATLTIAPGTTVLMASGGFLDIGPFNDPATLVAIGTATEPIVFTSEAASPLAGDWQCVRVNGTSSQNEIQHVTFEYGGAPCAVTGADPEGMLQLSAGGRTVSNNTFRHSQTHGVMIDQDGAVRGFANNTFDDNTTASIRISSSQLLVLGEGLAFDDADDVIEIDGRQRLETTGTWRGQPVPFRIAGNMDIGGDAVVTIGEGVTLQFTGASLDVFNGNLIVAGTETNPVVFTSAATSPLAGDWGCVTFQSPTGVPRFDHAIFEYAGNGVGCSGAEYNTALNAPATAIITNSTFRNLAGTAIRVFAECDSAAWCMNTFESVAEGPLDCDSTLISCL